MNPPDDPFKPPSAATALPEAPGAKASLHLGIWSILLNVLCGCFPVAIPLAIAAILKHRKAERAALEEPGRFAPVSNAGLITGVIGLCLTLVAFLVLLSLAGVLIPILHSGTPPAKVP
jgi:hypothetical protein